MPNQVLPQSDEVARAILFIWWNGDGPTPECTHWTSQGTIIIRALTPGKTSTVYWRPARDRAEKQLGFGDIDPRSVAVSLHQGSYDNDARFQLSRLAPKQLGDWNNLGR